VTDQGTFRFAGSGTTSATLNFLIYSVAADRNVYFKLKAELREAFPGWPAEGGEIPPITTIQKLPYTNAVISETLRRFPTIPGAMPRRVIAEGGLRIGDLLVPKNVGRFHAFTSTYRY
jgi:cytochrome P450